MEVVQIEQISIIEAGMYAVDYESHSISCGSVETYATEMQQTEK